MSPDDWEIVSSWLNQWLAADGDGREQLRARLAAEHPHLLDEAEGLARAGIKLPGFLETPALVLQAPDIASDDPLLPAGTEIGPYRILTLLARGGTGDVYRASDTRLYRDVALKVLAQSRTVDPQRVDRFIHEARVTASLDHPNIVRVYDVGRDGEHAYLVAELLEGETLRARIARGPLPVDEVVRIGREVARGLAAAHAAGLVHRDLKPDNIFLTRNGTSRILDFGIAKLAPDRAGRDDFRTMTGVVLGTAGYLAPEQIRGMPVDARADLFALGTVLFEMLTGTRAFGREHIVETLHAILHDPPSGALSERMEIPPAFREIVGRLLEKAPDARFQSADELIAALEHATTGESGARVPLPQRQAFRRAPPPDRRFIVGGIALAALALVAASWVWLGWPGAPRPASAPRGTENEKARERHSLGVVAVRRPTPDSLWSAVKYFEEAIALDEGYADAWAGLASAYKRMPILNAAPPKEAFEKARAAARRALDIDPANAEAISTLGTIAFWYDWNYAGAEALLEQAIALQPAHADSHLFLAHVHSNTGRPREALDGIRRAQRLDQQWAQARALEGQFLYIARRYADAVSYLHAIATDIDPGVWTVHLFLGDALLAVGRTQDALEAYDRAIELNPHPNAITMQAFTFARMNRRAEAEAALERVPGEFHYGRAMVLHALGRDDETIAELEAAVGTRNPHVTFLGVDPRWDDMRNLQRFREIARRLNLLEVSDRFRP